MKETEEPKKKCNAVSRRGLPCKYDAKPGSDLCGRCANKKPPRTFKKGIENPNGLNFGSRGWTSFLDEKIIELASRALATPDYFNLTQEIEFVNVDLARLAQQLASGNGYPFDKWTEIQSLFNEASSAYFGGDGEKFYQSFTKLGSMIKFCNEQHFLRAEFNRSMSRKGDFIARQQSIKEKERLYVELEKMLVFGASIIQTIEAILPKHDKLALKYRQQLFTALAPRFGFEINRTKKLQPLKEEDLPPDSDDDYIIDGEIVDEEQERRELESDDYLEKLLKNNEEEA